MSSYYLLKEKRGYVYAAFVVSLHPGCPAARLQFPPLPSWRLLRDAWLELWATGPLDLWVLHFCALDTERGSSFTQPCPFLAPVSLTLHSHLLDTSEELSSALWKGKKPKGKKSETPLFHALNSMALASLRSHDTALPPSSLFLGVSLNLFFMFFFLLSLTAFLLTAVLNQALGIFSVLEPH